MRILLLGHGKYFRRTNSERNLSIDREYYEELYNDKNVILTLHKDPQVEPDVCFDFRFNDYPFEEKEFDLIIDASGPGLLPSYHKPEFWQEINRILKLHGFFLGRQRSLYPNFEDSRNSLIDNSHEQTGLINRNGLYERPHLGNKHQNYLSLEKMHRPKLE